jgi:hypothetical protein
VKNGELTGDLSWLVPYDDQLIIYALDSFHILNQVLGDLAEVETWHDPVERQDAVMISAPNTVQLRIGTLVKPGFGLCCNGIGH